MSIPTEELLLLTVDKVTEYYDSQESAVGTLVLYLISVPKANASADLFLYATLPSGLSMPLPSLTVITKISESAFQIHGDDKSTITVNLDLMTPFSGPPHDRPKEELKELVHAMDSIFTQFCLMAHLEERNSLVLVDSTDGHEVGVIDDIKFTEAANLKHDKSPVEIVLNQETGQAVVQPLSEETPALKPNKYENDTLITTANDFSKGMIYVSTKVSSGMDSTANWWVKHRPAAEKPVVFTDSTKKNFQTASKVTGKGAHYSHKAVGVVTDAAATLGAKLAPSRKPKDKTKSDDSKRGLLSRSFLAFSTVMDGVDASTQTIVKGAVSSSSRMLGHSYGSDAEQVAVDFGHSVNNCTMVYKDARGISRRAILKGIGMGAVKTTLGHGKAESKEELVTMAEHERRNSTADSRKSSVSSIASRPLPPPLPARPPLLPERPPLLPARPSQGSGSYYGQY